MKISEQQNGHVRGLPHNIHVLKKFKNLTNAVFDIN